MASGSSLGNRIDPEPIAWTVSDSDSGREGSIVLRGDRWGTSDRPHVLLAHGGGQTRHSWRSTAAELARHGWCATAMDLRGHGDSDRSPTATYSPDRFARDLVEVAGQFPEPPVLVGASLGGLAALRAEGSLAKGSLRAVVLVDITPRQEKAGVDRIVGFMLERAELGFASLEEAAEAVARYQPHRAAPPNTAGLEKNLRLGTDGRWRWHWDPAMFSSEQGLHSVRDHGAGTTGDGAVPSPDRDQHPFLSAARALTVPTMLVRGRLSDLVSEETAQEFLELVPHALYTDVSDAGHMVAGDQNDRFSEAVITFLDSLI